MLSVLSAKRWGIAASLALLIMLAALLPVAAQVGAPCYLNGVWYADGTIISTGPVLEVCDNGRWRVAVFEQWGLIQRIDPKLLDKVKTIPPVPDPQP